MNISKLMAFVIYFLAMLTIGFVFFLKSRKQSGEKDYFLGGRSMGPWVTAMSAQASDMSGWLLMGFPGSILAFGMGKVWIGIGLALGTILNWVIMAKRLRRFSKAAGDSITLPQYLTNRFASQSPALKVICAVIFLIAFTVYVASAFNAGTTVFCSVIPWFETRKQLAMIIFAAIILVYTFMGGYKAVCWTDFFQGILMLVALLAVPIIMFSFGNFDDTYKTAFAEGVNAFNSNPFTASWQDIASGLGWGLGYFGMPHILVRFMSIKKSSMVKKSSSVAIIWVILTLGAAMAIAYFARTYLLDDGSALAVSLIPAGLQQNVFIKIVDDIFPGFIAGILLSAIIAASMSTADSQLLVASSSFTSDIYKPIIRRNKATDKELLWVGRIVVLVVTVVALLISLSGLKGTNPWASNIMAMVENAWGLFGAAFGPVVILSLFWKRFNYAGAVAGIVAGAAADIAWLVLFTSTVTDAVVYNTGVYEIIPGFVVGAIVSIVVTLVTKAPGEEVVDIYNEATDTSIDD
ncbi:MAG: sodium/proline symporter [Ruminococcaceae bacterium]|nr:sodium/proline symporter [Oscillospiraceae bacterium]